MNDVTKLKWEEFRTLFQLAQLAKESKIASIGRFSILPNCSRIGKICFLIFIKKYKVASGQ